ncbi:ApaG domain-containing protein [Aphelenchoides bicaudatus]|nr:ApaG domain-containing protein [Aphelenchoides bicaudatus]
MSLDKSFLHKTFAYRGIIMAAFGTEKRQEENKYSMPTFYQVLVHKKDWSEKKFPTDSTVYLSDNKEGRVLNVINGLDSVPHSDILPLNILPCSSEEFKPLAIFEHDLFSTLFKLIDESKPELGYEPVENLNKQRSWMIPRTHHENVSESIFVSITTYYLGSSISTGQLKHYWRYVIRIQNLSGESVVLRERAIKIFSLNNLTQVTAQGVLGEFPVLTKENSAYQFSSTIDLPQRKGGHVWGRLTFQRGDASTFEVDLPTTTLECSTEDTLKHTSENTIY